MTTMPLELKIFIFACMAFGIYMEMRKRGKLK